MCWAGLIAAFLSLSQTPESDFGYKVKVEISSDENAVFDDVVTSTLKRELRELTGVQVVDDEPQAELHIIYTELEFGVVDVYSLAVTFTGVYTDQGLAKLDIEGLDATYRRWFGSYSWVGGLTVENLRAACVQAIAAFDTDVVEWMRKIHFQLQEHKAEMEKTNRAIEEYERTQPKMKNNEKSRKTPTIQRPNNVRH